MVEEKTMEIVRVVTQILARVLRVYTAVCNLDWEYSRKGGFWNDADEEGGVLFIHYGEVFSDINIATNLSCTSLITYPVRLMWSNCSRGSWSWLT